MGDGAKRSLGEDTGRWPMADGRTERRINGGYSLFFTSAIRRLPSRQQRGEYCKAKRVHGGVPGSPLARRRSDSNRRNRVEPGLRSCNPSSTAPRPGLLTARAQSEKRKMDTARQCVQSRRTHSLVDAPSRAGALGGGTPALWRQVPSHCATGQHTDVGIRCPLPQAADRSVRFNR